MPVEGEFGEDDRSPHDSVVYEARRTDCRGGCAEDGQEGLVVQLQGLVRDVRIGPRGAVRSKMPSALAFLRGNRRVKTVIGTALALVGAVIGLVRGLRLLSRHPGSLEES